MTVDRIEDFQALEPFFRVIEDGLAGLVDGGHFFDLLADDGPNINEYFSPQRMSQLHLSDLETGANGVNDCGFHPSSSSTSPGRGRMVATARRYMNVDFEGKLHISDARARTLFGRRWAGEN
jgi:hypothetical protein